jgi:hypothetical protein
MKNVSNKAAEKIKIHFILFSENRAF